MFIENGIFAGPSSPGVGAGLGRPVPRGGAGMPLPGPAGPAGPAGPSGAAGSASRGGVLKEVERVRKDFPETWIWMDAVIG